LTRQAYELDLRQYASWCHQHHIRLFQARRPDIECFARDLETRGRARATITRRLCTIAGFYRYAVEEDLLEHSPAAHVRRLRLDYESHATGLDRNELGALLVAAGLGSPGEHTLISLLALNGLRVSEATGANIEALGVERGHRTLVITRRGGKVVTIPLAPRTARAIDLAVAERVDGPIFYGPDGLRLEWPAAPGSPSRSGRTRCDTRSSPPPSTPEFRCARSRKPPRTPTRAPRCATTVPAAASTGTPPTSSPPTSPEPPGKRLTAHKQTPPGQTVVARRSCGSKPRRVTDRDPNCEHEPPLCTGGRCSAITGTNVQIGSLCARTRPDLHVMHVGAGRPACGDACSAGRPGVMMALAINAGLSCRRSPMPGRGVGARQGRRAADLAGRWPFASCYRPVTSGPVSAPVTGVLPGFGVLWLPWYCGCVSLSPAGGLRGIDGDPHVGELIAVES